ncbi:MAG TPA: PPOX class F420-dependent oxidoreductase [Dehalococcoidia bacterium]|nr:PPOX class F420-dependent oxidoreductase [Dehalococcoidia bacterium]
MAKLTEAQAAILKAPVFAYIATINPDGSPQTSPVWIDYDGTHVIVNSEIKRAKVRNVQRDPRVSISVQNPDNPYSYIEIRGRVVDMTEEGAFEDIDRLAKKYLGQDKYPYNKPDDRRVILKIEPTRVLQPMG